jgi:hypothetical protein
MFFDVVLFLNVEHSTKDFRVICGYIFRQRQPLCWDSLLVGCSLVTVIISSHFNFDKNNLMQLSGRPFEQPWRPKAFSVLFNSNRLFHDKQSRYTYCNGIDFFFLGSIYLLKI